MSSGAEGPAAEGPVVVLLVQPYKVLAEALAASFESCDDLDLRWTVDDADRALDVLRQHSVDVLLFDVRSARAPAASIRRFKEAQASCKVLLFGLSAVDQVVELLEAGAAGHVRLDASFDELQDAIRRTHRHQAETTAPVIARALERLRELSEELGELGDLAGGSVDGPTGQGTEEALTAAELEVLRLISGGYSNEQIRARLGLSLSTVKMHVHRLLGKLGADGRRDAVRLAVQRGLLDFSGDVIGLVVPRRPG